jgi:membrane-associated protease RseP (regulator of RpoE activity)
MTNITQILGFLIILVMIPFLAAFVEPDEKQMDKKPIFPQLSVLAAGTFANVVFFIIFGLLFWLFFITAFTPSGVIFNTYAISEVDTNEIVAVNGISINNLNQVPSLLNESPVKISTLDKNYFVSPSTLAFAIERDIERIEAYDESPALKAGLKGAIYEFDGKKITSYEELSDAIKSRSPGDEVTIKTYSQEESVRDEIDELEFEVVLDEREGQAFLGIGIAPPQGRGLMGLMFNWISKIKDPFVFYQSSLGSFG